MLIETVRPANPVEGQMVYDPAANTMSAYTRQGWVKLGPYIVRFCAKCGVDDLNHGMPLSHPFLGDNLRMVEWEYEQRKTL